jgi:hypothetical protein
VSVADNDDVYTSSSQNAATVGLERERCVAGGHAVGYLERAHTAVD